MTDDTELRRAAEAAYEKQPDWFPEKDFEYGVFDYGVPCPAYIAAASPDVVLRILDERDRLREALKEFACHCDKNKCWDDYDDPKTYCGRFAARSALEDK